MNAADEEMAVYFEVEKILEDTISKVIVLGFIEQVSKLHKQVLCVFQVTMENHCKSNIRSEQRI